MKSKMNDVVDIVECGCGGKALLCSGDMWITGVGRINKTGWYVSCPECHVSTAMDLSFNRAINTWNIAVGSVQKRFQSPFEVIEEEPICIKTII